MPLLITHSRKCMNTLDRDNTLNVINWKSMSSNCIWIWQKFRANKTKQLSVRTSVHGQLQEINYMLMKSSEYISDSESKLLSLLPVKCMSAFTKLPENYLPLVWHPFDLRIVGVLFLVLTSWYFGRNTWSCQVVSRHFIDNGSLKLLSI